MSFLRTALLTGVAVAFCGLASAQLVPGGQPAPVPPPPPPPAAEPAAAPAPAGGLVSEISLADIKALFTGAGVPYEEIKSQSGRPYLVGKPNGWVMFVVAMNCTDDTVQTGCKAVLIESGSFVKPSSAQIVNDFNAQNVVTRAVLGNNGQSYTRQVVLFNSGVSPTYLRESLAWFTNEMAFYADTLDKAAGAAAPTSGGGTFASGAKVPEFSLQSSTRTGRSEDASLPTYAAGSVFK